MNVISRILARKCYDIYVLDWSTYIMIPKELKDIVEKELNANNIKYKIAHKKGNFEISFFEERKNDFDYLKAIVIIENLKNKMEKFNEIFSYV